MSKDFFGEDSRLVTLDDRGVAMWGSNQNTKLIQFVIITMARILNSRSDIPTP